MTGLRIVRKKYGRCKSLLKIISLIQDLLGSGNFSDVFRGKMELENVCVKVALKNSKKLNEMLDPAMNKEASKIKKEMIQEAEVMSQLRHTNITAVRNICSVFSLYSQVFSSLGCLLIVCQF